MPTNTMEKPGNNSLLSPLDQIRQAEADIARMLVLTQETEDEQIKLSKQLAARILAKAQMDGEVSGKEQGEEIIAKARSASAEIILQAQRKAERISTINPDQIKEMVSAIADFITGTNTHR